MGFKLKKSPELEALRKKIKKYAETRNFLKMIQDESGVAFSTLSQFKDGKRGLSINNFISLSKTIQTYESMMGNVEKKEEKPSKKRVFSATDEV